MLSYMFVNLKYGVVKLTIFVFFKLIISFVIILPLCVVW